jgi:hypothetical protein
MASLRIRVVIDEDRPARSRPTGVPPPARLGVSMQEVRGQADEIYQQGGSK